MKKDDLAGLCRYIYPMLCTHQELEIAVSVRGSRGSLTVRRPGRINCTVDFISRGFQVYSPLG